MKFADYKCKKCNKMIDYCTESETFFPEHIPCECGGIAVRIFSPLHGIVHQGKVGNSNNGYQSNLGKVKKT